MKIILKDIDHILFPEFYGYRKDRFKMQQEYLKQTDADNYLGGIRNIKFVIKIAKLSHTTEHKITREFLRSLYEQLIDISFDWYKPYDWHELKPILLFFTIFIIAFLEWGQPVLYSLFLFIPFYFYLKFKSK